MSIRRFALAALASALFAGPALAADPLLNVSYDPTRELYVEFNNAFNKHWQAQGHEPIKVQQSHGGSGKQARAVIDGLRADVVTLALAGDIDELHRLGKLIPEDWQTRLPDASTPYTSTIVFLVRKGNPKGIKDWDDLVKPGVKVIVVNPKTGGNGRYAYLAALGYMKKKGATDAQAQEFLGKLYANVPVLARGGRDATSAFLQRNTGDVLVNFESEVESVNREFGANKVDVVYPSISIVAENPVAVVEHTVAKKGTGELAKAYLQFLYSEQGQEIAAKHSIRPRSPAVLKKYADTFKPIKLFTVQELFGSLSEAQKVHFNDGGLFDKIYTVK